jgi:trans-aconitate 2-methyltransferase
LDCRPESCSAGGSKKPKNKWKITFSNGGKGNSQAVLGILDDLLDEEQWKKFFEGFVFPYGFFSAEEYAEFLDDAGLKPLRVELFSSGMKHAGEEELTVDKDQLAAIHGEITN